MQKEVALARLTRLASAETEPTLDALDLEYLLSMSRRVDINGASYSDADWIGTWNINQAVSRAWEMKAGKCADKFNFSSDVNSFQRRQVFENCLKMAEIFRKRSSGTLEFAPSADFDPVIGNI